MAETINLDFYFDPSCRWAWWTSIWIRRVARERPINITWKLFSLAVQDNPADYTQPPARAHHIKDFDMHRALALAARLGGNDAVARLYVAFGNALHGAKEDIWNPSVHAWCLETSGLPTTLFNDALHDPSTEADVIDQTREALQLGVLGTPSIALSGSDGSLLGPVIGEVPSGQDAMNLWDGVYLALTQPYIYELKRSRKTAPESMFAD